MIDIVASAGLFDAAAEKELMERVYTAFLDAVDATRDENVQSITGVALHVLPAGRMMVGGRVASSAIAWAVTGDASLALVRSCAELRGGR